MKSFNAAEFLAEVDKPRRARKGEFRSEHSLDLLAHEIDKLWLEVQKLKATRMAWHFLQRRGNAWNNRNGARHPMMPSMNSSLPKR